MAEYKELSDERMSSEADPTSITIGEHEYQYIAPDQFRFILRGEFTYDDSVAYVDFIFRHMPNNGRKLSAIYDLTQATGITNAARKHVTRVTWPYPFIGMAVLSPSFAARAMMDMIMRATRLLDPQRVPFPHKFVTSMEEAQAWLGELRAKGG